MEDGDARTRDDLSVAEIPVGFNARQPLTRESYQPGEQIPRAESENRRDDQTVDDLDPLIGVHTSQAALKRDGGSGDARDERMALRCGYAEPPPPRPHTMMATIAAANATRAACSSPPKSTILKMVWATADDTVVMPTKPMKLQTAAMAIAWFGFIARVPTTVAMALGASVAPLTMVAPNVSTTISASTGSLDHRRSERHEIDLH